MTDEPPCHHFAYVHADIPQGMTIRQWHRQRAIDRHARKVAERDARRRARRQRIHAARAALSRTPMGRNRERRVGRRRVSA